MVEQPKLKLRPLPDVQPIDRLARLHHSQQVKCPVEGAGFRTRGNREERPVGDTRRPDEVPLVPECVELGVPAQTLDGAGSLRAAGDERVFAHTLLGHGHRRAEQGGKPCPELVPDDLGSR